MSYCVNCGVELDDSSQKCALCLTPVWRPDTGEDKKPQSPFSDKLVIPKNIQRRFIAYIITMIMLIPNIVMFFVNVFFVRGSFWSVYVFSSSFLVWTLFVFPFCTKKVYPYLLWGADTLVTAAYVYVFFIMNSEQPWMFKTAFSVVFLVSLSALIFIIWMRRKKHHWTAIVAHVLFDLTLVSFIVGAVMTVLSEIMSFLVAGIICSLCFLALFGFFLYCNRSKRIRAWLNKAFYI